MSCERTPDVARPWQYHMEAYNSKQAKEEQSKVFCRSSIEHSVGSSILVVNTCTLSTGNRSPGPITRT